MRPCACRRFDRWPRLPLGRERRFAHKKTINAWGAPHPSLVSSSAPGVSRFAMPRPRPFGRIIIGTVVACLECDVDSSRTASSTSSRMWAGPCGCLRQWHKNWATIRRTPGVVGSSWTAGKRKWPHYPRLLQIGVRCRQLGLASWRSWPSVRRLVGCNWSLPY